MGGSQLSQLKTALAGAGLSRQNSSGSGSSKNGKKKRSGAAAAKARMAGDAEARNRRLEAISQSMNRFDTKTTRTKHQVLNAKPTKGATGRPGLSKQVGIDNRRKTLLPQFLDRNRSGGLVDRRFGEGDASLTPEEKALQRFTVERQRKASKNSLFNLDDEQDGEMLTHYGQSLSEAPAPLADQEDLFRRALEKDNASDEETTGRKRKSKAEVMEEVIAKSKAYKHERQRMKDQDEDLRLQLDDELSGIRSLLGAPNTRTEDPLEQYTRRPRPVATPSTDSQKPETTIEKPAASTLPVASTSNITLTFVPAAKLQTTSVDRGLLNKLIGTNDDEQGKEDDNVLRGLARVNNSDSIANEAIDDPYDRFVKELAYDKRAQPSDRLKTDVEIAQEAAAELQRSEQARLKRMRDVMEESASDDEDSNDARTSRKRRITSKGKQRAPQGDDLGDEFEYRGDEPSGFGLGEGLLPEPDGESASEDGEEGEAEEATLEDATASDQAEESGSEDAGEDDDVEDEGSEKDENEMLADLLHDDVDSTDEDAGPQVLVGSHQTPRARKTESKELPFTFPCPTTHDDLLDILESTTPDQLSIIIERIRVLYHPSLAEGNKQKLALFLAVLIDHLLYTVSAADAPTYSENTVLLKHILSMVKAFPLSTSSYCVRKLGLMQKNLVRGLQSGPSEAASKTWPGAAELTLLRLIGTIWSTSDFSHPVVAPAMLLISQYLGQCRVRDAKDIASGLFLCTLVLQYESQSKRLVPEALGFLAQVLLLLLPLKDEMQKCGHYSLPDLGKPDLASLRIQSKAEAPSNVPLNMLGLLQSNAEIGRQQADLLSLALTLLVEFATMHNPLPAFVEMFAPIHAVLEGVDSKRLSAALATKVQATSDSIARMLKFSRQARRPLTLQQHKPIPIPSYVPKFDAGYAPGRRFDPDVARNEESKLKALVKKEKKGAVRELRKDARFIAGEKAKLQREKDEAYKSKINRITAGLEQERAEEKRFERTKEKEKARDKKRGSSSGKR